MTSLTWEQLKACSRIFRLREDSFTLEGGTVTFDGYTVSVAWEDTGEIVSCGAYSYANAKYNWYDANDPKVALAMQFAPEILMVKALSYRFDLLIVEPGTLPLLQQIRQLIGHDEINRHIARYQCMSALPQGQRLLDICLNPLCEKD